MKGDTFDPYPSHSPDPYVTKKTVAVPSSKEENCYPSSSWTRKQTCYKYNDFKCHKYFSGGPVCNIKELFQFCHGVIAAPVITGVLALFLDASIQANGITNLSYSVLELLQVAVATGIFVSMWGVLATHSISMAGTVWWGLESA